MSTKIGDIDVRNLLNFYSKKCLTSALVWYIFFAFIAYAADVQVSSRLSNEETTVGVPVRMEITVQGARTAQIPRNLAVKGLQAHYVGESVQVQMVNFQVSTSSSYTFDIFPLQPGDFTIPDLQVQVNGKTFRTRPLSLRVYGSKTHWSTSGSGGSSSRSQATMQRLPTLPLPVPTVSGGGHSVGLESEKLAFGILMIPKKKIYVGEVVPVEICYYFHPDLPVQSVNSMPSLIGDDFVVQKISDPQQGQQKINGMQYMVLSFRSSIRPLKTGELQLPSTSISCQILTQARPEIPAGIADAFFQQFLASMPGVTRLQKMDVKSNSVTIQVIPLPEENRPDSFRGAIGKFALRTEVSPRDPAPGDPVTLQATISGEGNFDQIGAPALGSKQGWQFYPPSSNFTGLDNVGYLGKKAFEWMLVPKEKKTTAPAVEFSYFNPTTSKYVTLRADGKSVDAGPAPEPFPTPLGNSASVAAVPRLSPPTTERAKFGIARKLTSESFQPIITRGEFVIANAAAFLGLLAFLGIQLARRHAASGGAEKAALRRSLTACWTKVSTSQGIVFYSTVVQFLHLWVHATTGQHTEGYSAEEVVSALSLQGEEAALISEIFSRYEESKYGAQNMRDSISTDTRTAVLKLLKRGR